MDQRQRILIVAFAVVFGGGVTASVIYPRWIKPLVTIKDAIAELEEERDALAEDQREVDQAVREFRRYVNRAGSFDIRRVENELRARLNDMLAEHHLESVSVTPNTPKTEKKTGLHKMTMTVKAEGTLASAIKLMRDMAELPQLMRVLSTSIQPITSRKRTRGRDKAEYVSIAIPVQIMALPQQKLAGMIPREKIEQPDTFVRHENRDYSAIWTRTPFTEYIVYPPLVVKLKQPDIKVLETKRCNLEAVATGGDGDYEFAWTPSSGIDKPTSRRVRVDTKSTGKRSYTVSVTDGQGASARATANVEITAKPKPKPQVARNGGSKPPSPPPPPTGPQRWRNGRDLQLCMALLRRSGAHRENEIMVVDQKSHQTSYYGIGDDFDAGTLVYVHPTGALVCREVDKKKQYFIYPIGGALTDDLPCESAADYPKLQASADWFKARDVEKPMAAKDVPVDDSAGNPAVPGASEPESDALPPSDAVAQPAGVPATNPGSSGSARSVAQPKPIGGVNNREAAPSGVLGGNGAKALPASPGQPGAENFPAKRAEKAKRLEKSKSSEKKSSARPGTSAGSKGSGAKPAPKATRSPKRKPRGTNRRGRGVRAKPKQNTGKTSKSSTKD